MGPKHENVHDIAQYRDGRQAWQHKKWQDWETHFRPPSLVPVSLLGLGWPTTISADPGPHHWYSHATSSTYSDILNKVSCNNLPGYSLLVSYALVKTRFLIKNKKCDHGNHHRASCLISCIDSDTLEISLLAVWGYVSLFLEF